VKSFSHHRLPFSKWSVLTWGLVFFAAQGTFVRTWGQNVGENGSADLKRTVRLTWKGLELRSALSSHPAIRSSVWLDRRIDPQQQVDFSAPEQPLGKSIGELATKINAQAATVSPALVVITPRGQSPRLMGALALTRQNVQKLKGKAKTDWNKSAPFKLALLDEPRLTAEQWAKGAGWTIANPNAIPHDLLPEFQGPSMSLAERLQILLFGFNLAYEFSPDDRTLQIVELPEDLRYKETYRPKGDVAKIANDLKKSFPDIEIARRDKALDITASAEDHWAIAPALLPTDRPQTGVQVKPGEKRFTLQIENQPAGAIVRTIATELGLTLDAEADVMAALQQRVSVDAVQTTLDKLLEQALKPASLRGTVADGKLRVEWIDDTGTGDFKAKTKK
jgi:hypothetical protein